MANYGKKASEKVEKAMHERKTGQLKSGKSDKPVKSRAQAIAIGLSEARKEGAKVPKKKAPSKKSAPRKKRLQKKRAPRKNPLLERPHTNSRVARICPRAWLVADTFEG